MENNGGAIDGWIRSSIERTEQVLRLKQLYQLQAEFLFNQYEPIKASPSEAGMDFIQRMDKWVSGFDDPIDQWSAFHSLRYFFFIGQQETEELYRCSVQHKLHPWVTNQAGLDIFSDGFSELLQAELARCWPCPVTDSLRINSLLHRTDLDGQSLRPDWLSLRVLGDCDRIQAYATRHQVKYLILFEDFVGSGQQCKRATQFALRAFSGPILLIPLVVCHPGDQVLRSLAAGSSCRLTYDPVVVLGADCLVGENPSDGEPRSFQALRVAMQRGYDKGKFDLEGGAYGYDGVGSLLSSYSNCPNNAPPIFHAKSSSWPFPLFPRKRRA